MREVAKGLGMGGILSFGVVVVSTILAHLIFIIQHWDRFKTTWMGFFIY